MRSINRYLISAALLGLVIASPAVAQDTVEYRDLSSGQVQTTKGNILEEGVGGINLRATGGSATLKVAPSQIVQVIYADLPKGLNLDYPTALSAEKEREYEKALRQYEKVLPMIPPDTNSRRQAEFRIAMLKTNLIGDDEESVSLSEATSTLKDFINTYSSSWQFTSASQALARLQLSDGKFDDALSTLKKLNDAPDLQESTKEQVNLMIVDALLRTDNRKAEAKQKIDELLASLPNSSPQRQNLEIYSLVADENVDIDKAIKTLEGVIEKSTEPSIRALAYNTMGDLFMQNGKNRDAMWSYLWVDVVYSQDPQQQMNAVTSLRSIFEQLGDTKRAKLYEEKLKSLR